LISQALRSVFVLGGGGILDEATKKGDWRSPFSRIQVLHEDLYIFCVKMHFSF